MNIYDALNLAEDNGHRASLQSDGRWFLIRKSDRAIVNIGYSIIEAVSVLVVQPEPVVEEVVEVVAEPVVEEVVEVVAEPVVEVAEVVAEPVAPALPTNITNFDIVTLAEANGFRCSLQATGEWLLIRKSDRMPTNVGYDLRDALPIINPKPETFAQIEIERGYAAMEEEEHQAWLASQKQEEVNVVSDDEELTFNEAVEVLAVRGDQTEEMIDEARAVIVQHVTTQLVIWDVTNVENLDDWVACTTFDGTETTEILAREFCDENSLQFTNWTEINNSYALYDERDTTEYSAWLKQQEEYA